MPAKTTTDYRDGRDFQRHLGSEDASQGQKTGHMRWVLGVSIALVVVGMFCAYLAFFRPASPAATGRPSQVEAPLLPSDRAPATTPPANAAPQSSQPLP